MKQYFLAFAMLTGLLLSSVSQAAERKLSVLNFDTIKINGSVNVVVETGKGPSATAKADSQQLLDRLQLRNGGSELIVTVQQDPDDASRYSGNKQIDLFLTGFAIKSLTHLGAGRVSIDELKGTETFARVGGFGSVDIGAVDTDNFNVVMNGGGAMVVNGSTSRARLSLLGASSFQGENFKVKELQLTQRGPATSRIAVERQAEITNTGSGQIEILGKPDCVVRSSGAAEIICNHKR